MKKLLRYYWKFASFMGGIGFTLALLAIAYLILSLALSGCLFTPCRFP